LIQRSVDLGFSHDMPVLYCEYNSYHGAIHSTGVKAMEDLFSWGVEQAGMAGGFLYMRPNSTSHPGVMDGSYNTHKIFNEAIIKAFADAQIHLLSYSDNEFLIQIANKRHCTLRQMRLNYSINNEKYAPVILDDLLPKKSIHITLPVSTRTSESDLMITGRLEFVTHYGFQNKVPFKLLARF
jgi:hypothetical protein